MTSLPPYRFPVTSFWDTEASLEIPKVTNPLDCMQSMRSWRPSRTGPSYFFSAQVFSSTEGNFWFISSPEDIKTFHSNVWVHRHAWPPSCFQESRPLGRINLRILYNGRSNDVYHSDEQMPGIQSLLCELSKYSRGGEFGSDLEFDYVVLDTFPRVSLEDYRGFQVAKTVALVCCDEVKVLDILAPGPVENADTPKEPLYPIQTDVIHHENDGTTLENDADVYEDCESQFYETPVSQYFPQDVAPDDMTSTLSDVKQDESCRINSFTFSTPGLSREDNTTGPSLETNPTTPPGSNTAGDRMKISPHLPLSISCDQFGRRMGFMVPNIPHRSIIPGHYPLPLYNSAAPPSAVPAQLILISSPVHSWGPSMARLKRLEIQSGDYETIQNLQVLSQPNILERVVLRLFGNSNSIEKTIQNMTTAFSHATRETCQFLKYVEVVTPWSLDATEKEIIRGGLRSELDQLGVKVLFIRHQDYVNDFLVVGGFGTN